MFRPVIKFPFASHERIVTCVRYSPFAQSIDQLWPTYSASFFGLSLYVILNEFAVNHCPPDLTWIRISISARLALPRHPNLAFPSIWPGDPVDLWTLSASTPHAEPPPSTVAHPVGRIRAGTIRAQRMKFLSIFPQYLTMSVLILAYPTLTVKMPSLERISRANARNRRYEQWRNCQRSVMAIPSLCAAAAGRAGATSAADAVPRPTVGRHHRQPEQQCCASFRFVGVGPHQRVISPARRPIFSVTVRADSGSTCA